MHPWILPLALIWCSTWTSPRAHAQSTADGVLINADVMDRDMEANVVRLRGNVQVVFQGQHLSCDRAELDLGAQRLTAEGHVILSNPRVHVEGDRIQFNYKQNTGLIYNGFVRSGQVVFEGDVVEKASETRYIASNAEFTACDTCPSGWSFSGRRIDAEVGGYARIRRPVFKIGGVPVLILPSLIVPLKSSRESGVLVPTQEFTQRGGFGIGESYFWAIDRSRDLTLTGKRIERRGLKAMADYRYKVSESGGGDLRAAFARDRALVREFNLKDDFGRWLIKYDHHLDLPGGFVHRANLAMPSDLRYARDFPDELPGHGQSALQNRASVSKSTDGQFVSGEVDLYTNLLKAYPLGTNDDAVHRAPEIRYSLRERRPFDWGPYVALDVDYVNFGRASSNYDDLNNGRATVLGQGEVARDGMFNSNTDLFRTGQRLDVRPTLTYPFQLWRRFDVLPAVSYRETQYRFSQPNGGEAFGTTAARRYVQADLRAKTEFSRVFESRTGERWKHAIEPEVGYSRVPWMRRPDDHPFFGPFRGIQYSRQYQQVSDADITDPNTRVQFDYEDRTFDRDVVDFTFSNRLTKKILTDDVATYKTAALLSVWQSYDLREAREARHPWSSLSALLDLRFNKLETYTVAEYNGYAKVTNTSSRLKLMATPRNYLQFSFTRNTQFTSEYRITPDTETRNIGFGAGFVTTYVEAAGMIDYSTLTSQVQSWQYEVLLRPPGHCWSIRIMHRQMLGGDAQIFIKPAFDFGGTTSPAVAAK